MTERAFNEVFDYVLAMDVRAKRTCTR